jgi:hypothetical protein
MGGKLGTMLTPLMGIWNWGKGVIGKWGVPAVVGGTVGTVAADVATNEGDGKGGLPTKVGREAGERYVKETSYLGWLNNVIDYTGAASAGVVATFAGSIATLLDLVGELYAPAKGWAEGLRNWGLKQQRVAQQQREKSVAQTPHGGVVGAVKDSLYSLPSNLWNAMTMENALLLGGGYGAYKGAKYGFSKFGGGGPKGGGSAPSGGAPKSPWSGGPGGAAGKASKTASTPKISVGGGKLGFVKNLVVGGATLLGVNSVANYFTGGSANAKEAGAPAADTTKMTPVGENALAAPTSLNVNGVSVTAPETSVPSVPVVPSLNPMDNIYSKMGWFGQAWKMQDEFKTAANHGFVKSLGNMAGWAVGTVADVADEALNKVISTGAETRDLSEDFAKAGNWVANKIYGVQDDSKLHVRFGGYAGEGASWFVPGTAGAKLGIGAARGVGAGLKTAEKSGIVGGLAGETVNVLTPVN